MQLVTVGSKYQIVIPKEVRKKFKGLQPGTKVAIKQIDDETISIKATKKTWADETYGIMKDAWKGINPAAEIDKMRDEWDEKAK